MVSEINSAGVFGLESYIVSIEADVIGGKFAVDIVGLPDAAVSESGERIRAAVINSGYTFPDTHLIINLAPADIRKEGPLYDLPMYIATLCASRQLEGDFGDSVFIGELSLSGEVRRVSGVLPMAIKAAGEGFKKLYIPAENSLEASVVEGIQIYPVKNVAELLPALRGETELEPVVNDGLSVFAEPQGMPDFADVKGQFEAKRALEIAAAGGHNVLMIGSPGSGKSMLAKRLPSILPEMTFEEAIETTKIYSVAGMLRGGERLIAVRPFRSPHHTISPAGLSGGGAVPKPGEISLAHNGVLFLDELPEFSRTAMEVLRQPIEDGEITIARVAGTLTYPCSVMLVCAMNPCPCGYYGHPTRKCTCPPGAAAKYLARVSGPLLDRIDIHIEVQPVNYEMLSSRRRSESSADIRARVNAARKIQSARFAGTGITCNARMDSKSVRQYCQMDADAQEMLRSLFDSSGLSARAYDKILKVARTAADLRDAPTISRADIAEALQYRSLDRKYWLHDN